MPNMIAYGALIAWPIVTIILFSQLGARKAIIWSLVAAYLILPVNVDFDPPGLPSLDKTTIPNLAALVCTLFMAKQRMIRLPRSRIVLMLMIVFVLSPIVTGFGNRAPIIMLQTALPGMSLYDSFSACGLNALTLTPFILGYSALQRDVDHLQILRVLVIAALFYSLPILYEVRFAPVLHRKIYGIEAFNDFQQMVRFGGYRPAAFMGHGLLVSMFCAMALTASMVLWRLRLRTFGLPTALVCLYLAVILILMKSVGSIVLAAVGLIALLAFTPRRMTTLMLALSLIIVTYPAVRATRFFPGEAVLKVAGYVSAEREQSLRFRLENEDRLLAHANQKALFGWGTWGRNQVFQQTDWGTDVQISTTDGSWIIAIGQFGWVGYVAMFGLLCHPFWRAYRQGRGKLALPTLGLLLILMLNLIDLIPNASLRPLTWLIAGALSGMTIQRSRIARPKASQSEKTNRGSNAPDEKLSHFPTV
ncbi:hypothetical protein [Sphingobium sp. CR28]|uniref:hypothetical protein n=1 Tax=Sphingobium sp. CR28 TaxID=3400272 RepID=UPI003FEF9572